MIKHLKTYRLVYAALTALVFLLGIGKLTIEIDDRYAHAEEYVQVVKSIQALNDRIEQQAKADKMMSLQQRIWQIQDHYKGKPMPIQMVEEIRFLQMQLQQLKAEK